MNIQFETWVENQGFSKDSKALFVESIKCYRVSAYRGAYLLSYVGFLSVIKERILNSERPNLITEGQWEKNVLKDLRNDDKWEEHTYNLLNKRNSESKSMYFLVNTHLLSDIDYFKRRRNDCAHAKDTIIDYSHVEVLWNFLQSHLSKFVVNGGKEGLLNKIKKHYDPEFTRPNSDPSHLINEIPMVVEKSSIPDFLSEINDEYIGIDEAFTKEDISYVFWSKVVFHQNVDLHEELITYLDADKEKFALFMHFFPDQLEYFSNESPNIRYLWKEALFSKLLANAYQYWELPLSLLRRQVIPKEEKYNFINRLVKEVDKFNLPNIEQTFELKKHGFFTHMKNYVSEDIFDKGRASYIRVNNNSDIIMYCLKHGSLDCEIVKLLNKFFNGYEFGDFKDALETHIEEDYEFLKRFHEIASEIGIEIHPFFIRE